MRNSSIEVLDAQGSGDIVEIQTPTAVTGCFVVQGELQVGDYWWSWASRCWRYLDKTGLDERFPREIDRDIRIGNIVFRKF